MNRRAFLHGIAGTTGGAAWLSASLRHAGAAAGPWSPRRPSLIFVLVDDLGWAELGCYGNGFNETPHLDRLAREGMRFTDAYAAAPVCSPTRAAFLTGQYPARVGITDYLRPSDPKFLSLNHFTLAEALGQAGYACGLVGKWHLMGDYRLRRGDPKLHGFAEVICSEQSGIGGGSYFHPYRFMPKVQAREKGEYLTDRLNQEAVDFVERHRNRPFFLYLSHYAVHTRLVGKPDKVAKYAKKPGAGKNRSNPGLAAMLESIDDGIGMILAKLDELGLADQTVLVFTSDNGGEHNVTSNAPLRGAKSQLYEGGIRVPLLVRWPGVVKPGTVCRVPVSSVDFYPTFLEMARARPDPRQVLDGESLMPLLKLAGGLKREALFWHYPLARPHFLGGRSSGAVRKRNWKLIEFYDTARAELYNLRDDPGETTDLAARLPEKAAELRQLLADWGRNVGAQMPRPATGPQLHLKLDEPAGTTHACDASGAKRHLVYHGTEPVPGREGRARRFNGTDDYLDLARDLAPSPAGQPVTVSAWIQPEQPDGVILAHGGDRHGYALYLRGGCLAFSTTTDWKRVTVVAKDRLPQGWVHVAGQLRKGGGMRLFVHGKPVASGKAPGLLPSDPGDSLQVGADTVKPVGEYEAPNPYGGAMADVKVVYGEAPAPGEP